VNEAEERLRAALAKLPSETRKAIAESARQMRVKLEDPDSELNKGIKRDIDFIFGVIEKLKSMPDDRTRSQALAKIVRRTGRCPKSRTTPK
jgi:hypothetical protein